MTPRRPPRDYHLHRHDLTPQGLAAYYACPRCTPSPHTLTPAGAAALAHLLHSIESPQ